VFLLAACCSLPAEGARYRNHSMKESETPSKPSLREFPTLAITWLSGSQEVKEAAAAQHHYARSATLRGRSASGHSTDAVLGNVVSSRALKALMQRADSPLTLAAKAGRAGAPAEMPRTRTAMLELDDLDMQGVEYVGSVGIGTDTGNDTSRPQAELRVIYDTGSADLWIGSDLCEHAPCTEADRHRYNHSLSSTFQPPPAPVDLVTVYGSGRLTGRLGIDSVRVGPLVAKYQTLGLIKEEEGSFEDLPFDGIVGLGFQALLSHHNGSKPLVQTLIDQEQMAVPQFAFYLHRDPAEGGALLWGDSGKDFHRGNITWVPVADKYYWALELLSVRVGNFTLEVHNRTNGSHQLSQNASATRGKFTKPRAPFQMRLLVDSGTTFNTVLPDIYTAVMKVAHARPCSDVNELPSIVYTVLDQDGEKKELEVTAEQYMVRSPWSAYLKTDICFPGVVQAWNGPRDSPLLILGEVFMRHHFTIFHWGDGMPSRTGRTGVVRPEGAFIGFAEALPSGEVKAMLKTANVAS